MLLSILFTFFSVLKMQIHIPNPEAPAALFLPAFNVGKVFEVGKAAYASFLFISISFRGLQRRKKHDKNNTQMTIERTKQAELS